MPKEQYMCQLCANHGIFNQPKKGHKQKCPYRTCPCSLCALNTKRRALDQIERQLKNTNEELSPTSPISPSPAQNSSNQFTQIKSSSDAGVVGCQISPTTARLQSSTAGGNNSGGGNYRSSMFNTPPPFCVQLPATITRKELKLLRRDDIAMTNGPNSNPSSISNSNLLKRSYKSIDDTIETIKKQKSIFHSAEMLANS